MRKRILATLLAACLVLGITPEMANAVESDFTIEDGVLIKYTGSDSTVDIPSGVTKIGDRAFYACSRLTSVTIPNGVTNIGYYAFEHCSNLTTLDIPDSVITINSNAFAYCNSLASITIPSATTDIGRGAFKGCSKLISIQVASENQAYTSVDGILMTKNTDTLIAYPAAKQGPYTVPDNVTNIEDNAFEGCGGLTSVIISDGVISIGNWAFSNCSALTNATIPDTVATIGHSAFYRCNSLSSITVPSGVTNIEDSTFYECSKLTSITLPNTVVSIGTSAFHGCTLLTGLMLPSSVTTIGNTAFRNCTGLICASIPDGVTSIEGSTFYGCTGLASVIIPSSVTSIGSYAFCDCNGLTDVYYAGSAEQWNQIEIDNYGEYNSAIINATKHYNSTGPDDTPDPPTPPTPGDGSIVSLFPVNGATDVGYDAFNPPEFRITFDREINTPDGDARADVDLTASGAFAIYRTSDDQLIWKPNEYSDSNFTVEYGDKNTLIVQPTNRHTMLEPNTQYYITMGEGFVRFADGTGSPEIEKGEWRFRTRGYDSVTFTFASGAGNDLTYSGLSFDNGWFLNDSYSYNHELAEMSLGLAMAGFGSNENKRTPDINIQRLFRELYFDIDTYESFGYDSEDSNSVAMAICQKEMSDADGNPVTLLAVCLRGSGYGNGGWVGNFTVGNSGPYHEGFNAAATKAYASVRAYIASNQIDTDNIRIWLTGYSRSAAIANLLSAHLRDKGLCKAENIYTYAFAVPNNQYSIGADKDAYNNIFNIINPSDVVPLVPLLQWGFGKLGTTYMLPRLEGKYTKRVQQQFASITHNSAIYETKPYAAATLEWVNDLLGDAIPNRENYVKYLENIIMDFVSRRSLSSLDPLLCGVTTTDQLMENIKTIIDSDSPLPFRKAKIAETLILLAAVEGKTPKDSPVRKLVFEVCNVLKGTSKEVAASALIGSTYKINHPNTAILESIYKSIYDIVDGHMNEGRAGGIDKEHWPDVYFAWMTSIDQSDLTISAEFKNKITVIKCPVDVNVYDQTGTLVAQVIDNMATEIEGSDVSSAVLGESRKVFVLPNDQCFQIEIIATDSGSMSYSIYEKTADGTTLRTVEFNDIGIKTGDAFTGTIDDKLYTANLNYALTKNDTDKIYADYDSYASVPVAPNLPSTPTPSYPSGNKSGNTASPTTYSITLPNVQNGKLTAAPASAPRGTLVTLTASPAPGYELASLTVTDSKGNALELSDKGGGKYTFTMPSGKVTVDAVFQAVPAPEEPQVPWANPFTDVAEGTWYYDAVKYVSEKGLMNGTGSSLFSPDATTTRAMIWTILARLNGVDTSGGNPWYKKGQDWATANQISDGTAPDASITREQLITMLWRYKGSPNTTADMSRFADSGAVSEWAKDAIEWAVSTDLLQGSGSKLDPTGTTTRAQVATILQRYCETLA